MGAPRDCRVPRGPATVGQKGVLMTSLHEAQVVADPEALARRVADWLLGEATRPDQKKPSKNSIE